jgi:RimJ/RimL family protein N-acetyltransferase
MQDPEAVELREVIDADYAVFFQLQRDAMAARMAAFGTQDPDADAHALRWKRDIAGGETIGRTIVWSGAIVGFVARFLREGKPQVTYWIGREAWGHGVATAALSGLLRLVAERPLYASAAEDNVGSLRVLEKCGFVVVTSGKAFADARGEEIIEVFLELR